jgi:carbon-monoxide dehydrogenase medium subunit
MKSFNYYQPSETEDLFKLVKQYAPNYRILAGGTDLLVRLKSGRIEPDAVIDIKHLPELAGGIHLHSEFVSIGALTLMATLENNSLIQELFPALADAVHNIGSVQIRNRATIAGNLCNASPAADSAPALLIYNASVKILSPLGERVQKLQDFITGPGRTALKADELVKEVILPVPPKNQAATFARLTRRKGVDLATINLCCQVDNLGVTRFALGAVGPVPIMVEEQNGMLTSSDLGDEEKKSLIMNLMRKASPISDVRASKEYRQAMLTVLGIRALKTSLERLNSRL